MAGHREGQVTFLTPVLWELPDAGKLPNYQSPFKDICPIVSVFRR